ncbi:MAG TPA: hypothetical protein VH143_21960 [Kofleriaceae bacterium]|jgi:hypothetical protein|nr:hypothetical protein [Kofleriaceae bacterium]
MRILPVALALSAVAHGGLALALAVRNHAPSLRFVPTAQAATPGAAASEPISVAFIDDVRQVQPRDVGAALTQHIAAANPAHRGTEIAGAAATAPSTGAESTHGSPLMAMRQKPPPSLEGPSEDFISRFLAKPSHAEPNPIEGERIDEEIAAIEHDPNQRERLVELYNARDAHELRRDGSGYKATHQTWTAHVDSSGHATFEDKPNWQGHGLGGSFDITDALMRRHGADPYAAQKRKFLDDTLEERYQIGKRTRHELLQHSGGLAYEALENVWTKTTDIRQRKQAVFELWDDCAESGNADLVEGGRAAREMIVGFIQMRFVGTDAYTPDELAALNAHKTSTATFAPYAQ